MNNNNNNFNSRYLAQQNRGMGGISITPLDFTGIPPDLHPRQVLQEGCRGGIGAGIGIEKAKGIDPSRVLPEYHKYMTDAIYLGREMVPLTVSVITSPTLLINSTLCQLNLILNPTRPSGVAERNSNTISLAASGNTQANYIDCAGYQYAHTCFDITSITGEWGLYLQVYDHTIGEWFDSHRIFDPLDTAGNYYVMLGPAGIGERIAYRFDMTSAGAIAGTLTTLLKGGYGDDLTNWYKAVYLGGPNVTTDNGFPLPPGTSKNIVVGANVPLYAIAASTISVKIFQL